MSASDVMYGMETDLLMLLVDHIGRGNIGSAEWQEDRLSNLGVLRKQASELVTARTDEAMQELKSEIARAQTAAIGRFEENIDAQTLRGAMSADASPRMKAIVESWQRKAAGDISITGAKLIPRAVGMFEEAAQRATAKVLAGNTTARQAMREIGTRWARQGVPALVDAAGKRWSVEAYTQAVVRSNIRAVTTETQLQRARETGEDLVEISAHDGARPGCEPYQGKVFSVSGDSEVYPALDSTTYGEPDGLFGINCGHRMTPYKHGQKKRYEPRGKEENRETYKRSQQQRALERSIRKAKREAMVGEGLGDNAMATAAKQRVRAQQEKLRSFIDSTGRTRRRDREQLI